MSDELNAHAFGKAAAILAIIMSVLGVASFFGSGMMGFYPMGASTPLSIIIGIIVSAVAGYIIGWLFATFYNWSLYKDIRREFFQERRTRRRRAR